MITKDEYLEWRMSKVTQKLIELVKDGQHVAVQDLIAMRGEIGDYHRGVGAGLEEVLNYVSTGEGIYSDA